MYELNFDALSGEGYQRLFDGFLVTCHLAAWSLLFALCVGVVFGIVRWLNFRYLEPACWLYIEFARNTPPLVQILFWYFSASFFLPDWLFMHMRDVGYEFSAAVVAFTIYHGAFMAEVIRAGLNSVDKGQYDASRALGLGFFQRMGSIILPQAIRVIIPPMINETVALVKNTSLALAVGVTEIAYQYKYIDTYWFRGIEALLIATGMYLTLCLTISGLGTLLSRRLSRHMLRRQLEQPVLISE
jgi:polar amino acid transport system permease protein